MKKVFLLSIICLVLTACASNVDEVRDSNNNEENKVMAEENIQITIETNKGDIDLELYKSKAPITVDNFIKLIKEGFYKDIKFHRVIDNFMIQTGDPYTRGEENVDFVYDPYDNPNGLPIAGTGGPGYKFGDEFNDDLAFDKPGILAMANSGPNTNGSQIFITHVSTSWLNNKHTIFGQVISGQDVVDVIEQGDVINGIIIK